MKKVLLTLGIIFSLSSCTVETDYVPWVSEIGRSFKYKEESKVLMEYLHDFVEEAAVRGIDLSHVYDNNITIQFTDLEEGFAGKSFGLGKDGISIFIDYEYWKGWEKHDTQQSRDRRRILMYHELGHDILDLEHGSKVIMMLHVKRSTTIKRENLTMEDLIEDLFE